MRNQSGMDAGYQLEQKASGLRAAVQTAEPAAHMDVMLQTVAVQGDQAVARVVSHTENGEPVYQQTRFYQRTAAGWRYRDEFIRPGSALTLETADYLVRALILRVTIPTEASAERHDR